MLPDFNGNGEGGNGTRERELKKYLVWWWSRLVTTVILSNLNSPTQCLLMSSRILYMNAMKSVILYYIFPLISYETCVRGY